MHDTTVRLFDFLDALPDAMVLIDASGRIAHVNAGLTTLLGYPPESLVGHQLSALIPPRFREQHLAHTREFMRSGKPSAMSDRPMVFALAQGGIERAVSISLGALQLDEQRCTVAVLRDASCFQQSLGEVVARAETDALTGLGNRRAALSSLEHLVESGQPFAVLFLDLVGFKQFNDRHGHHVGDEVLAAVAGRIRASVRSPDIAARLGGDEFLVLMTGLRDGGLLQARAEAMSKHIVQPMHVRTVTQGPGVTIGAALFPRHATTAEVLLQRADQAMYRAKREGLSFCLAGETPVRFASSPAKLAAPQPGEHHPPSGS